MRKIIILQFVLIVILLFAGCSKKNVESNVADNASIEKQDFTYSDTLQILSDINEILTAASKGAGNPMAKIGGFSEELETIKSKSEDVIACVEHIVNTLDENENGTIILDNSVSIAEYYENFDTKLSEIKTAKQNTDISALKIYLSEMIEIIDEYQIFLSSLEEELK